MDPNTALEFCFNGSQLNKLSIEVSVKFMSQGKGDKEIASRISEAALDFLKVAEEIILDGSSEVSVKAVGGSAKPSDKGVIGFRRPE